MRDLLASGLTVRIRVSGASMRPLLQGNEALHIEPISGAVRIGDLLVFVGPGGKPVVHRLVRRLGRGKRLRLQMKGDGAPKPDAPVPPEAVLGRVCGIESKLRPGVQRNESRPMAFLRAQASLWHYRWRFRIR